MSKPLVSIIIPTYNRSRLLLQRAIPSALNQTYSCTEVIVVDDGSTDGTADAVEPYVKGGAVKYLFQNHRGPSAARNLGVRSSRGELVIFLDDDDEIYPDGVRAIVEKASLFPPAVAGFACGMELKDEKGNVNYFEPTHIFWENAISGCWALRRLVFADAGIWFDESIRRLEDVDFMMKFREKFEYTVIRRPIFRHYIKVGVPRIAGEVEDAVYFRNSALDLEKITALYENVYRDAGKDAFAWFKRFQGTILCRAGVMREGRRAFWEALMIKPSLHSLYLWLASLWSQKIFLFLCGLRTRVKSSLKSFFRGLFGALFAVQRKSGA